MWKRAIGFIAPIGWYFAILGPDIIAELCAVLVILIFAISILTNLPIFSLAKPLPVARVISGGIAAPPQYEAPLDERATKLETEYDDMNRRIATNEAAIAEQTAVLASIKTIVKGLQDKETAREQEDKERDKLYTSIAVKCSFGIICAALAIIGRVGWDIYKRVMFGNIRRRREDTQA
jgi:hypothetical protein